ncbi:hypothetical protein [Methylacidimicrobium tartarophylax]|uniref:Uncharacterized protein n=1 Tax=Methylacidimicrobium tartarophylax TaxID=1041768 RepID=A0A5E6MDH7_9BACT|nr:hypothetical protein [Methylacidimicrobium tartarophylax]VVM07511.1 hypothetical protein MAMT_01777 [Methylacidimicrobium tartarophylax]
MMHTSLRLTNKKGVNLYLDSGCPLFTLSSSSLVSLTFRSEVLLRPRIGLVTDLVEAAGGVGGFLLPICFGLVQSTTHSYAAALLLFAGTPAVAAAVSSWDRIPWERAVPRLLSPSPD